jgi:hypothetical protein
LLVLGWTSAQFKVPLRAAGPPVVLLRLGLARGEFYKNYSLYFNFLYNIYNLFAEEY